jgi:hypothetical protein
MQRCRLLATLLALLLLPLAGCDDGSGMSAPDVDPLLVQQTGEALFGADVMAGDLMEDEATGNGLQPGLTSGEGTIEITISFDVTAQCPLGGELNLAGEMNDSLDFSTWTRVTTFDASRTLTDCVFEEKGEVLTVNSNADLDAMRRFVRGRPDGLQTKSYGGSVTAVRASDGETLTCDFSARAELDPDNYTYTFEASICGNEYSKTVTWTPGEDGQD